jgi:hypothetical protein
MRSAVRLLKALGQVRGTPTPLVLQPQAWLATRPPHPAAVANHPNLARAAWSVLGPHQTTALHLISGIAEDRTLAIFGWPPEAPSSSEPADPRGTEGEPLAFDEFGHEQALPATGRAEEASADTHQSMADEPSRPIMIWCEATSPRKAVPTGFEMTVTGFERGEFSDNRVSCPHCGQFHTWNQADAFLESGS